MSFWDIIWYIIVTFAFVAYLMIMFNIVVDLFRDRELSGGLKAVWIVLLVVFPMITAIVYLITRGDGMAQRQARVVEDVQARQEAYIRSVSGPSPAEEIEKAKALLDAGTISPDEYAALKAKALA